jgi:hypothetical protein
MPVNEFKEDLELRRAPALLFEKERVAAAQVERAKDGAPRVAARDGHWRGLSAPRPAGAQRWKEQEIGLVLCQKCRMLGQAPDLTAQRAFFSPAPDRARARSFKRFQT